MAIDREAWLAAMQEVNAPPADSDPDVLTAADLESLFGVGRDAARARAEKLVARGLAERTRKRLYRSNSNGAIWVTAYRLKPESQP